MAADLIIYALVAAGLIFWLRSILGTRHGDERQRPNPLVPPPEKPVMGTAESEFPPGIERSLSAAERIEDLAKNPTDVLSVDNKTAENGLLDIARLDKNFDVKFFLQAAQDVFAIVVESFAEGDRETLKDLLSEKVYKAFEPAITEREKRGETQEAEIHAISKAQIIEAKLEGKKALITVRFAASQTSVTYDKDKSVIAGHPEKTSKMIDIWTFGRDVKSSDPRWLVVETRGDFEDDNDLIPDTE